jgi:GNAT superfamily N-acetyltransferase
MNFRFAAGTDAPLLATMNYSLIRDLGLPNYLTVGALEQRMENWLAGDYQAVLFEGEAGPAGYALFRSEPEYVYLRQFFVVREVRRHGIGRSALDWLKGNVWSGCERIRIDVLPENRAAIAFWHSVGFSDLTITMEATLPPAGERADSPLVAVYETESGGAKMHSAKTLRRVA